MRQQICLYNSKVFVPYVCENGCFLVAYSYTDNITEHFKEILRFKLPLKSSFETKCILIDTVDNYILGTECIVILAISHSNNVHIFSYCNTSKTSLFEIIYEEFKNDIFMLSNCDFYPSHGPSLLMHANNSINIYALSNKKKFDIYSVFPANDIKVLQFNGFGQITKECLVNIMLLVVSGIVLGQQTLEILIISINMEKEESSLICDKLNVSLFFSSFLKTHTKALHVDINNFDEGNTSDINDIDWEENSSVICTNRNCFIYIHAELKYCINLFFEDVHSIYFDYSFTPENASLVLFSSANDLYFYKPQNDLFNLQLKSSWSDIKTVLIGDILLNGSEQMILLKNVNFESWKEDYIITDISNSIPVNIQDQGVIPDECLTATLSGLHSKFQIGKTAVAQKELEIQEKIGATLDALHKLDATSEDEDFIEIMTFQESLVDIILKKHENQKEDMIKRKNSLKVKLVNHWIKFINGCWFLGYTFLNKDKSVMYSPTLKLISQEEPLQYSQKIFLNATEGFTLEDKCTKQINPSQIFSVISVIQTPSFTVDAVELEAILLWFAGSSEEFENEMFLPMREKCLIQKQLPLKKVTLKSLEMFANCEESVSMIEDIFCFKVLHHKIVFKISSLYSDVCNIESTLLSSDFGTQHLTLIGSSLSQIWFFKHKSSVLHGAHFALSYLNENSLEMEAFVKAEKDLFLLLQFLKKCFPKDVIFVPSHKTKDEILLLKQKMISSMKEEVALLVSALNSHNIASSISDARNLPSQSEAIIIPKETFSRVRKALLKLEAVTDCYAKQIALTES